MRNQSLTRINVFICWAVEIYRLKRIYFDLFVLLEAIKKSRLWKAMIVLAIQTFDKLVHDKRSKYNKNFTDMAVSVVCFDGVRAIYDNMP